MKHQTLTIHTTKEYISRAFIYLGGRAVGKCIVPGLFESKTYEKLNEHLKH